MHSPKLAQKLKEIELRQKRAKYRQFLERFPGIEFVDFCQPSTIEAIRSIQMETGRLDSAFDNSLPEDTDEGELKAWLINGLSSLADEKELLLWVIDYGDSPVHIKVTSPDWFSDLWDRTKCCNFLVASESAGIAIEIMEEEHDYLLFKRAFLSRNSQE